MSERVDHIWKMKKVKEAVAMLILKLCLLANLAGLSHGALQLGFYRGKCGIADVEMIVAGVVTARFIRDPTIVAALIRLQFHDCFVNVSFYFPMHRFLLRTRITLFAFRVLTNNFIYCLKTSMKQET